MRRKVHLGSLLAVLLYSVHVYAQQNQPGFISIDCGADASYTDEKTTIFYKTDAGYIDTGTNKNIAAKYRSGITYKQQYKNVRSFPQGKKNCYTLKPTQGKDTNYLIRAYFMYGNYDSLDKPPTFELLLGVDVWDTVKLSNASQVVVKEIIHTPSTDYIYVCLGNIGSGSPFISGLELRTMRDSIYKRVDGSLDLMYRYYTYTTSLEEIRYKDDVYDREWTAMYLIGGSSINTTSEISTELDLFKLPSSVMKAAIVPPNVSQPIHFFYTLPDPNAEYYLYLHVAELQKLSAGQVRQFDTTVNGLNFYRNYTPKYLLADTIFNDKPLFGPELNVTIQSTKSSTLPPLLNALEIFIAKTLKEVSTNDVDVESMAQIEASYNLTKDWQGDPCVPRSYSWAEIRCSYDGSTSPRIISLNLSSSGLNGDLAASIANLTALQNLDLSYNKLTGVIPGFLTQLPLKTLNLVGNSFTGSVPELLLKRSREGSLLLSVENDPSFCTGTSCTSQSKTKKFIAPVAACGALFILLLTGFIIFLVYTRKKKQKPMRAQAQTAVQENGYDQGKGGLARFTYAEVKNMTVDFQRELGKGGFGVVYYGRLKDGTEVAVKMLSPSINASEQFSTEVELLMAIRHKNLVSLVGYCEEGNSLALIYEYMAGGNLQTVISAAESMTWKERLQIAIDAAQGLDYLHNGCRPSIVHRDVKTPNILLNKNLQAKIADFGLSKIFPDDNKSYISTRVIGTPGYLDPEYHITQQLNEKSDVYSFGVVLLELITGKAAIVRNADRMSLIQWVSPMLERGDILSIVDERVEDVRNSNSLWRATDIAMACVKPTLAERPTMSQVVTELKECLAMEMNTENSTSGPFDSVEMSPMISHTAMTPAAR